MSFIILAQGDVCRASVCVNGGVPSGNFLTIRVYYQLFRNQLYCMESVRCSSLLLHNTRLESVRNYFGKFYIKVNKTFKSYGKVFVL